MKRLLLGLTLAAAGGLVACGGGSPQSGLDIVYDLGNDPLDGWVSDQPNGDSSRDPNSIDTGPCEEAMALDYVDEQDDPDNDYHYIVSLGARRDIRAKAHECGKGVDDVGVEFTLVEESYEGACTLDVGYTWTVDGGLVIDGVQGGNRRGSCLVKACLDDGETCLDFRILIFPKDPDPLIVGIREYHGDYPQLDTFKVLLFKEGSTASPTCEDLLPGALPTATTESAAVSIMSLAKFKQLPKLDTELSQTYTVLAQCWESKDLDKTVRAYGCKDDVRVEWGDSRYVEIDCSDIPPRIVGSYDLTSTFDLVSGLPPKVADVVDVIIGLFQNPTGQILLLMCHPKFGAVGGSSFCNYLFEDLKDPTLDNMKSVGTIVSDIINAILLGLLADNCPGDDPELCTNIFQIGGDVGDILKKFQLKSTMTCTKEPDKNGLLPMGTCREVWHTVILKWTLGKDCDPLDDECGAITLSMSAIPGIENAVAANIEAQLLPGYKLAIAKHPLDLKYGALVNFAIEKILLPQVFGSGQDGLPAVDSYEKLIGSLLAGRDCIYAGTCCAEFAANLLGGTSAPGLTTNLIEGACDALINTGSEYLRSTLIGLDSTPQNFQIGTPLGDPCQMFDHNKDMRFDALGAKNKPCNWDAGLTIGGAVYDPEGIFYGTRP